MMTNLSFARGLLRLHLDALEQFGAPVDQIDIDFAEDDVSVIMLGHVADNAVAAGFDPAGIDIAVYADAVRHPAKIFLQNGRVLTADEVLRRLFDGEEHAQSSDSEG